MKFKLFKACFLGLLLTVSHYSNAALVSFEFNSPATATEPTLTYEWSIDSSQPVFNIDWGIYYLAEIITTVNGISTTQDGSFGALTIGDSVIFSSPTRVSNGGFELFDSSVNGFFVAEGPVLFSSRIMGDVNFMGGSASFIDGQVSLDAAPDTDGVFPNRPLSVGTRAGTLITRVPEPSTFALLALGVIGLATRRFKKKY